VQGIGYGRLGGLIRGRKKNDFLVRSEKYLLHGYFKSMRGRFPGLGIESLDKPPHEIHGFYKRIGYSVDAFFVKADSKLPLWTFQYEFFV